MSKALEAAGVSDELAAGMACSDAVATALDARGGAFADPDEVVAQSAVRSTLTMRFMKSAFSQCVDRELAT